MGLSVPYWGRAQSPDALVNPPGLDGKFWYIRYFQPPGVAEAALESNTEASLRMIYHVISADSPPGSWLSQTQFQSDTPMSRMFQVPAELPRWLSQDNLDYHIAQFQKNGFRGGLNWYRNIERNWHLTPQLAGARIRQPAHFIAGA